jgi:hypothetical protein
MFCYAMLCKNHPGFREEREWRVVHTPRFEPSSRLIHDLQVVRGAPQPTYKIPLKNVPEENLLGVEIPELVNRIIIGPTQHPLPMYEAFVTLLEQAGAQDAASKVKVSDIPLRQ